jgi:hypothetical protein
MAKLRRIKDEKVWDAQEFAYSTNSSSVSTEGFAGYAITAEITARAATAKAFVDGDVTVATNVVSEASHGYTTGRKGQLTTTGVLPTGLATSTDYYMISVNSNFYQLASSLANAIAGTPVNITAAAGGGTHTFTPTALGSTTVKLQASEDDDIFIDISGASETITASSNVLWNVNAPFYEYMRIVATITDGAGQLLITSRLTGKGYN